MKKILCIVLVVVLLFTLSACDFGSSSEKDSYGNDKSSAMVAAQTEVKSRLKAPSTAKFCSSYNFDVSLSGNTWTVRGYVDAQNGFGATIRSNFTVRIKFTGKNKYVVESCSIN